MAQAGYSGTPLAKKLGLKDGQAAAFIALPETLSHLTRARAFGRMAAFPHWRDLDSDHYDYVHLFTKSAGELDAATPVLRDSIRPDGMIWVSWPKKASKVATDVTEDTIRNRARADVLVDVKVCAVDETWSGLKLVVRKELRAKHKNS